MDNTSRSRRKMQQPPPQPPRRVSMILGKDKPRTKGKGRLASHVGFDVFYAMLLKYYEDHGDCCVQCGPHGENKLLFTLVQQQRAYWDDICSGIQTMPPSAAGHMADLDKLGFFYQEEEEEEEEIEEVEVVTVKEEEVEVKEEVHEAVQEAVQEEQTSTSKNNEKSTGKNENKEGSKVEEGELEVVVKKEAPEQNYHDEEESKESSTMEWGAPALEEEAEAEGFNNDNDDSDISLPGFVAEQQDHRLSREPSMDQDAVKTGHVSRVPQDVTRMDTVATRDPWERDYLAPQNGTSMETVAVAAQESSETVLEQEVAAVAKLPHARRDWFFKRVNLEPRHMCHFQEGECPSDNCRFIHVYNKLNQTFPVIQHFNPRNIETDYACDDSGRAWFTAGYLHGSNIFIYSIGGNGICQESTGLWWYRSEKEAIDSIASRVTLCHSPSVASLGNGHDGKRAANPGYFTPSPKRHCVCSHWDVLREQVSTLDLNENWLTENHAICRFHSGRQGCRHGDHCEYAHVYRKTSDTIVIPFGDERRNQIRHVSRCDKKGTVWHTCGLQDKNNFIYVSGGNGVHSSLLWWYKTYEDATEALCGTHKTWR